MSRQHTEPEVLVTSLSGSVRPAPWMKPVHARAVSADEVAARPALPSVLVVRTSSLKEVLGGRRFLEALAFKHSQNLRTRIVFSVGRMPLEVATTQRSMTALFGHFVRHSHVDVAQGAGNTLIAVQAALARLTLPSEIPERDGGAFKNLRRVLESTADLRSKSGRLDATKIAAAFRLSVANLAVLLGRLRQTVSKTPDSAALQPALKHFERIVRLRTALSADEFVAWLNAANTQLDGKTPLEVVRHGKAGIVADLVEDMLSGAPT